MADSETKERQRVLAEKKRKLAEMKASREQRQLEERSNPSLRTESAISTRSTMTPAELDAIMAKLGIEQRNHREEAPSDPSSTNSTSRECNGTLHPDGYANDLARRSNKRPQNLEIIPVQAITIQPKNECISYCKTTQTDEERERHSHGEFSMGSQELDFDDELSLDEAAVLGQIGGFDESPTHEIRKHLKNLHFPFIHTSQKEAPDEHIGTTSTKLPPMSDEEKRKILSSADFGRFFQQASRVIERALAEDSDIFIDYITGSSGGGAMDDKFDKSELLTLNRTIFDEKLTANRGVRALDFSSFFPELVAVSYDRNTKDARLSAESVINVWNTRFKTSSPEMTFHCSSRVMSLVFDSFQPNIIIGGCYSGQICIWDTRVNKRMPVCKTSLSIHAHTQPILCMKIVGSTNAHDLVTISTDGRLCSWSIDNLQAPIEAVNLLCKTKRQISALSMAFVNNSINSFVVGSEENDLCIGDRHASKGEMNRITAHQMPVTTVDTHRATGSIDFSSLCLTGSLDFGIKLWNIKDQSKTDPLLCLERKHKFYITDVQWSPVHPAVFASLSSDGMFNLWNLNVNTENPITSVSVGDSGTRFRWNRNGQQLVVGDASGTVHVFDVHESLYNVRSSEWDHLKSTLTDLVTDETTTGSLH